MAVMPEYLNDQTEDVIRNRMLSSVPSDLDKSEGSFIWDSLSPSAIEFALAAIWAQEVLRRATIATTFGTYLDMRCEERGVTRKMATKASGQVQFTGVAGSTVPAGTQVATVADAITATPSIVFITTAPVTVDGTGKAIGMIEAMVAGSAGNVPSSAISLMAAPVTGITAVVNLLGTSGGTDIEDDDSLRERYYVKVRTPGTSGNKNDYKNWALSIAGIGGAEVVPLWNGPGTVKVYLIGADKQPANATLVTTVRDYIQPSIGEGVAPIGATVTVVAAEAVPISVTATVVLNGTRSLAEVTASFQAALTEYLKNIAFTDDPTVKYGRVGALLLETSGVSDYLIESLLINGAKANVTINQGKVAVMGLVTLT